MHATHSWRRLRGATTRNYYSLSGEKQVKQIQAGFEQELFAQLPIYRLPLIHK